MKRSAITLWAGALIPSLLLLIGIAFGAWKDYQASLQLDSTFKTIVAENASSTWWKTLHSGSVTKSRSAEVTREHRDLTLMMHQIQDDAQRDEIWTRRSDPFQLPKPDDDWSDDWNDALLYPRASVNAKLFIDRIEASRQSESEASSSLEPVAAVQELLPIARIILVDSLLRSDFEQAHRTVGFISQIIEDSRGDLRYIQDDLLTARTDLHFAIQQLLQYDVWTESQLDDFAMWVSEPIPLAAALVSAHDNTGRFLVSSMSREGGLEISNTEPPSVILRWTPFVDHILISNAIDKLENSDRLRNIPSYESVFPTINRLRKNPDPPAAGGMFSPTFPFRQHALMRQLSEDINTAVSLAIVEELRRLTLTAVKIKQFQKRTGEWPDSLQALKLTNDDVDTGLGQSVTGYPFEYTPNRIGPVIQSNIHSMMEELSQLYLNDLRVKLLVAHRVQLR